MIKNRVRYTLLSLGMVIISGCGSEESTDSPVNSVRTPKPTTVAEATNITVIKGEPSLSPTAPAQTTRSLLPTTSSLNETSASASIPLMPAISAIAVPAVAPTPVVPPVNYPGSAAEADETGRLSARMEAMVQQAESQELSLEKKQALNEAQENIEKTLSSITPGMPRQEFEQKLNEVRAMANDAETLLQPELRF